MYRVSRVLCGLLGSMLILAMIIPFMSGALAQDITKPQITDLTTGVPEPGSDYTIIVMVTDDTGVDYVSLYPYFIVDREAMVLGQIIMDFVGGDQYQTSIQIPDNASKLSYYIVAYDDYDNAANSDVISREITDNVLPTAVCPAIVTVNMLDSANFDGSASTDNTGIANYTWTITYNSTTVTLYGPAPTFQFGTAGTYTGRLTVKDAKGNSGFQNFQINVLDTEFPIADAGIQMYVMSGEMLVLDGSGSMDNAGVVNYTWSYVHNGTLVLLYGVSPSAVFWTLGVYEVTLTVTDAAENIDTATIAVQVITTQEEGSSIPWWVYAMIGMIVAIAIATIIILRT